MLIRQLILTLSLLLSACTTPFSMQSNKTNTSVEQQNLKAHVEFLSSDSLAGRDTGSLGHQIAANYIESQFKQLGLKPAGDNKSYFQTITLRKAALAEHSAQFILETSEGKTEFTFADEFIMRGSTLSQDSRITAELVFVGYGMQNKLFNIDDYAQLDVTGKIVVVLYGRPEGLPSEEAAHMQSNKEKARIAAANGAVGMITIHTPAREKVRSYEVTRKLSNAPNYNWLSNNKPFDVAESLKGAAYLNSEPAKQLFIGAKQSLESIFAAIDNRDVPKGFPLRGKVTLKQQSQHETLTSPNVMGILEGSDPQLKNEYVVFSAHLDHIGLSAGIHSDTNDLINNGALDNAVGSAVLLETARTLANMPIKPKRSILFILVTAEERGLLGSSYFANNPTVPLKSMIANINLDMPLVLYPFADVVAFGSTHSSLKQIVTTAAKKINLSLSPDPMPKEALFTRSDHYSFVKKGIPSVFLMTGFKSKDPAIEGGKMFSDFLKQHYHQPSDQHTLAINYAAAATFTQVNIMIGLETANQSERPTWNDDSFFGKTFSQ